MTLLAGWLAEEADPDCCWAVALSLLITCHLRRGIIFRLTGIPFPGQRTQTTKGPLSCAPAWSKCDASSIQVPKLLMVEETAAMQAKVGLSRGGGRVCVGLRTCISGRDLHGKKNSSHLLPPCMLLVLLWPPASRLIGDCHLLLRPCGEKMATKCCSPTCTKCEWDN